MMKGRIGGSDHGMPASKWFCTLTKVAKTPISTPAVASMTMIHIFRAASGQIYRSRRVRYSMVVEDRAIFSRYEVVEEILSELKAA